MSSNIETTATSVETKSQIKKRTTLFKYNSRDFFTKIIKITWIALKLFTFVNIFLFAILIKFLRQIIHGFLLCIDYLTNLGVDDLDGKIVRCFENIKKISLSFFI